MLLGIQLIYTLEKKKVGEKREEGKGKERRMKIIGLFCLRLYRERKCVSHSVEPNSL